MVFNTVLEECWEVFRGKRKGKCKEMTDYTNCVECLIRFFFNMSLGLQYCIENMPDFDQTFGIRYLFRYMFRGFLEDFGGDFRRIFGGLLKVV